MLTTLNPCCVWQLGDSRTIKTPAFLASAKTRSPESGQTCKTSGLTVAARIFADATASCSDRRMVGPTIRWGRYNPPGLRLSLAGTPGIKFEPAPQTTSTSCPARLSNRMLCAAAAPTAPAPSRPEILYKIFNPVLFRIIHDFYGDAEKCGEFGHPARHYGPSTVTDRNRRRQVAKRSRRAIAPSYAILQLKTREE